MLVGFESPATAPSPAMPKKELAPKRKAAPETIPGQGDRLRLLRTALGYETASSFAAFLGIIQQRYNAFENGSPLSREIAFRLVQKIPGLSLDWLYFGKAEGLPLELARRLGIIDTPGNRNTA